MSENDYKPTTEQSTTDAPQTEQRSGDDPRSDGSASGESTPAHVRGSGGESDVASLESTTIQRDSSGEIVPSREYVEELDADVIARPMPSAARERYIEETLGAGEDVSDEQLAEMFTKFLVEPDLTRHENCPNDRVTPAFIEESLTGSQEDAFFIAILLASDERPIVERLRATSRGEIPEDQIKMLDQLGPERMNELMDEAEAESEGGN